VRPLLIRPWVQTDILRAVLQDRAILGYVLFDVNNHLPNNLAYYQSKRIARNPRCFWYERTYSLDPNTFRFRRLRFVVRDSDPSLLEVIWVVVVA
jgi:hypothetical protein